MTSYELPKIFKALAKRSGIENRKLYNTFNMGIGMVLAVSPEIAEEVCAYANEIGEEAVILGKVTEGEGVRL